MTATESTAVAMRTTTRTLILVLMLVPLLERMLVRMLIQLPVPIVGETRTPMQVAILGIIIQRMTLIKSHISGKLAKWYC